MRTWANNLFIWAKDEPAMGSIGKSIADEDPGGSHSECVYKADDIPLILDRYANIQQIIFATHGQSGYMYLAGGGATVANIKIFAAPHKNLFRGEGRALFYGCNVAEGAAGLTFLEAAARQLFQGKGGIIAATDSKNYFGKWGLIDMLKPAWGTLRLIRVDSDGNVIGRKDA